MNNNHHHAQTQHPSAQSICFIYPHHITMIQLYLTCSKDIHILISTVMHKHPCILDEYYSTRTTECRPKIFTSYKPKASSLKTMKENIMSTRLNEQIEREQTNARVFKINQFFYDACIIKSI